MTTETNSRLLFYFDPICPWAWRTSLWVREAAKVRPLTIEWDFLSLQAVNAGKESLKDSHYKSEPAFRTMALVRRQFEAERANDLIGKLYLEIGQAHHERKEDITQPEVLKAALQAVGLDPALYDQAIADPTTLDDVQKSHSGAIELGSFGVPSLKLPENPKTTFGPVIDRVPTGEDAGELWDHVSWIMGRSEFYELKRSR